VTVPNTLLAVSALTLAVSLVCIWCVPSGQDFTEANSAWNGARELYQELGAEVIESFDELPAVPEKTVLMAIPYAEYTDAELAALDRFVDRGGTLLLMDDFGHGNTVLASLGLSIRFSGQPLLDPLFCYKNRWLPRATRITGTSGSDRIDVLMLNHATVLSDVDTETVLAWSSSSSFLDTDGNELRDEGEPGGPLPVAAEIGVGEGRVAVVSDPSIAINSMIGRDDNYNFIKYLTRCEGGEGRLLVDASHLPRAPLDKAKARLADARQVMSGAYPVLGLLALAFAIVLGNMLRKGETVG